MITGITGQDGAYLAELLLSKGYEVHGSKRRASSYNTDRIDHLYQDPHERNVKLCLHYGDLTDATSLIRIIQLVQPEIYNLAAQSHVAVSFETPDRTRSISGIWTRCATLIRTVAGYSSDGGIQDLVWLRASYLERERGNVTELRTHRMRQLEAGPAALQ
jgi:GDP-mannose 4,6-dehydratase